MCIGRPARVIDVSVEDERLPFGSVDVGGVPTRVSFAYLPDTAPGDWVVVHAGFAVTRVAEAEALEALALLDDLERSPRPGTSAS